MHIKDRIRDIVNVGIISIMKMSINDLRTLTCEIASYANKCDIDHFASTHLYSETGAKTEWLIVDRPLTRYIWIVKRVTRFADAPDFASVIEDRVLCVDRCIAKQIVDLLNSQEELQKTFDYSA